MSDSNQHGQNPPEAEKIEPIAFKAARVDQRRIAMSRMKAWALWSGAVLAGAALMAAGWFVFTARQVTVRISPIPDQMTIKGALPAVRLGDRYLLRPGSYTLFAEKKCYLPLSTPLTIGKSPGQNLVRQLEKSPGIISIYAHEAGDTDLKGLEARVSIDGKVLGETPLENQEIEAGTHLLEVSAERYQTYRQEIAIDGCAKPQQYRAALVPGWSEIAVDSIPTGARIWVDGRPMGATPTTLNLPAGTHDLELQADGYATWRQTITVEANHSMAMGAIALQPAHGELRITSTPSGASVMIDDSFAGQTPLKVSLAPDKPHRLQLSKAGYGKAERKVSVKSNQSRRVEIALRAQLGEVHFSVHPPDAILIIDAKVIGPVPDRLSLPALAHEIEIRKKGYHAFKARITPTPELTRQIEATLKPLATTIVAGKSRYTAGNGYPLVKIRPGIFTAGSSRREQGRRSNETLRRIRLTRPFLMGAREITNGEFRIFSRTHDSGSFKSHSLNRDEQPAVRVTWQQAAAFCNWLSAKDGLEPAYRRQGDLLIPTHPLTNGYRLPTEAEWEYCARFAGKQGFAKYPWGNDTFPPGPKSGNYGDESAKNLFSTVIQGYNDGYMVAAPPARFPANALGIYDMAGNVAEWCHDGYTTYSYDPEKIYTDPIGPAQGELRVIRGSSWKDSSISELRAAFRGYGNDQREDVGFRVCRYVK